MLHATMRPLLYRRGSVRYRIMAILYGSRDFDSQLVMPPLSTVIYHLDIANGYPAKKIKPPSFSPVARTIQALGQLNCKSQHTLFRSILSIFFMHRQSSMACLRVKLYVLPCIFSSTYQSRSVQSTHINHAVKISHFTQHSSKLYQTNNFYLFNSTKEKRLLRTSEKKHPQPFRCSKK